MPSPPPPRILDPTTLRVVWTVLVVLRGLALLYLLRTVLLVLAFAVVFAYLIFPLVKLAERGLPRSGRRPLAIARALPSVFGEYVRALVLLCVLTFVVWAVLFLLAGVPYALVLAAIGGALEFLPVVGPLAAGVTIVSVALFSGFVHPWLLALFIVIWRVVQDYVSSPLIMGRGVELHPGLVIFGVLAGGELAGVAGMFLSVPVIAGLKVVWRRLREFRAEP